MKTYTAIFSVVFLLCSFAGAAPRALPKQKEDKVLFMLFESQNRKTISTVEKPNCKPGPLKPWYCDHKTVKSVLMSALFVGLPGDKYAKKSEMECEPVTKALKEKALSDTLGMSLGPKAFRREIVQSLEGQWVCNFRAMIQSYEDLMKAKEYEARVTSTPVAQDSILTQQMDLGKTREPEVHTSAFGLSFLLNRDQSRIVSRNIVAWSNF